MVATLWLVVSCSTTKVDNSVHEIKNITDGDFRLHDLSYEVAIDEISDFVGTINIRDSIAYLGNRAGEELISVYNLSSRRRIGSTISRGRGPLELLGVRWRVQMNDDKKFAFIFGSSEFMAFPLDVITRVATGDTNKVFIPHTKFVYEENFRDATALDTNLFVGLPVDFSGVSKRLKFYDGQGNLTAEKGEYYKTKEMTFPDKMNSHAFDARIISRDDGQRIVVANMVTDQIEIYDGQGEIIRLIKGPDHFVPDVVDFSNGDMIQFGFGKKARNAYFWPLAKKEEFWIMYEGVYMKQDKSADIKSSTLMSFDWDGNPLDKYIIQADIMCFDVDESRGLIYAIIMTEDGEQKVIRAKYR